MHRENDIHVISADLRVLQACEKLMNTPGSSLTLGELVREDGRRGKIFWSLFWSCVQSL